MATHFTLVDHLPAVGIGLDVGSTLAKLAVAADGAVQFVHLPAGDRDAIFARIARAGDGRVMVTGAGAAAVRDALDSRLHGEVPEFDALAAGARVLLRREGLDPGAVYLVANVGTGTSVLRLQGDGVERVGGAALGGGTLMGLGRLLCRTEGYPEFTRLLAGGDRRRVDLLVRDVYPEGLDGVMGEATAANFGRVRSAEPADVAQGLCGLVGESLGLMCGTLARVHGASQVLFCGAALLENPMLTAILLGTTAYAGAPALALEDGAYCGALGALASLECPPSSIA